MPSPCAQTKTALKVGATREDMVETILRRTAYAGGPAVRSAFIAVRDSTGAPLVPMTVNAAEGKGDGTVVALLVSDLG